MSKWMVSAKKADFEKIAETFQISPVLARLLVNRGLTTEREISYYLEGKMADLHAPALLPDAEKAAGILRDKIHAGKKICIIGDYDVDGICASHILSHVLQRLGADVETMLPDRITDGYGMNQRMVTEACTRGVDTILTCDNGIAASVPIKVAKQLKLTVIVTDHHEVPFEITQDGERKQILPPADAIVNPKVISEEGVYPFPEICGALVAYKLMDLLMKQMLVGDREDILRSLSPFAAMATICDVMPLVSENRIIVKEGLREMPKTDNAGLQALLEVTELNGKEISAYHTGFILGPCLNASGRLDNAIRAFSLFHTKTREEALKAAQELKDLNDSRKSMTLKGVELAEKSIEAGHLLENNVLVVYLPSTHESLAGIIAGRLKEKYSCPVFVLTDAEDGLIKGSGRSIESYDMYAELSAVSDLFVRFGGHKMAAGLTLEKKNMAQFIKRINENCTLTPADMEAVIHIDMELPPGLFTIETVKEFAKLEPCGKENERPVFATRDLLIREIRIMGKTRNVAKLLCRDQTGKNVECMYFSDPSGLEFTLDNAFGEGTFERLLLGSGTQVRVKMAFYPGINEWRGEENLQFVIVDLQP
ncbi:MAG: single-stranded-DNA-specific exonuclease RecJ [Lachnospiraceae bacterium]|nr:single-stranded-DNA-specific exonuclease RecJ [Lachnospiraceae bacterium]